MRIPPVEVQFKRVLKTKRGKQRKPMTFDKFLKKHPEAKIWLDLGIRPRTALYLCKAGHLTLESVSHLTREQLLAIWSVGEGALGKIETALGRPLSSPVCYWIGLGLSGLAAQVLARNRITTIEQLREIHRERLLLYTGMGLRLLKQIEFALNIRIRSKYYYWTAKGLSVRTARIFQQTGIITIEQLETKTYAELTELDIHILDILKISRLTQLAAPASGRFPK